jgi:hypothetical protein
MEILCLLPPTLHAADQGVRKISLQTHTHTHGVHGNTALCCSSIAMWNRRENTARSSGCGGLWFVVVVVVAVVIVVVVAMLVCGGGGS